jgi:hypothetical protein
MKTCIAMLCCVLLSEVTQAQTENDDSMLHVYFSFEQGESELTGEAESTFLSFAYDLMLSRSVTIELLSCGSSYSAEEVMSLRQGYFAEACKEYQINPESTQMVVVNRRFEESPASNVHIAYYDSNTQQKTVRRESTFTHMEGWRARCYADEVAFVANSHVKVLRSPEELQAINLLTEDEDGNRLEIIAIVSIAFTRDTTFLQPIAFQIPLHGISETGCKEYTLMRDDQCTFPSEPNKASVKREDALMIWKIDVDRSGTYVIARPARDVESITFTAPNGYAITRATATSMSPYMHIQADIALNQLTATFSQVPDPENVYCEFVLSDMNGNEFTTTGITAKALMNDPLLSFLKRNENTLPDPALAAGKH